jgi:hypothetical protein
MTDESVSSGVCQSGIERAAEPCRERRFDPPLKLSSWSRAESTASTRSAPDDPVAKEGDRIAAAAVKAPAMSQAVPRVQNRYRLA